MPACMVHCDESDDDDEVINGTFLSRVTTKDVKALQKLLGDVSDSDAKAFRDYIALSSQSRIAGFCGV